MENKSVPFPDIFQFVDALEFLKAAHDFEKKRNPAFSHRFIAKSLGSTSSSLFNEILNRKVRLSPARILGFAKLFRLGRLETEYFETLVHYNQATNQEEKGHFLAKMKSLSRNDKASSLTTFQLEYFKKWHYAAIRELLALRPFHGDYANLGNLLDPPLSAGETMEAINLLLHLGLIRKTAGAIERVEKVVRSPSGAEPSLVRPAIQGNLELAMRALGQFPPEVRPFSYLTLSVSEESFQQIRDKLKRFRKEILDLVSADENVDRLYQLNFQFFPLSKSVKPRKK